MPATSPPTVSRSARRFTRVQLPVMYTLLRLCPAGEARYQWKGHIYDVSLNGMRFELDQALDPGSAVAFAALLPGEEHVRIHAAGRVVRLHNPDALDRGPIRMGLTFTRFDSDADYQRLKRYLLTRGVEAHEMPADQEAAIMPVFAPATSSEPAATPLTPSAA